MTQPSLFLGIGKQESFIEDYYHDYISNSDDKKEETIVEIADGIYDLLYSIIG